LERTVLKMLNDLKFVYKIALLPGIAGAGFVLILVASLLMGQRSAARLQEVEHGYAPSLELSRDMENLLAELQRTMQDAVAAVDVFLLEDAAAVREAFITRVESQRLNAVHDPEQVDQIEAHFEAYYQEAYSTASRMIAGETGDDVLTALQDMTTRYNTLNELLVEGTGADQAAMTAGFAAARNAQRMAVVMSAIVTILSLAGLIALSVLIARWAVGSMAEFGRGFARMSAGDFTTKLPVQSKDEIGQLSAQANEMMDTLGELIGAVIRGDVRLSDAAAARRRDAVVLVGADIVGDGRDGYPDRPRRERRSRPRLLGG
jgi:HAMP domain-containing protein